MRVGSTFTGVGGADLGLKQAGMSIAWQCEIDPWKQSILKAHWPSIPIYDDITTLHNPPPVDLLIGGFPCQDLSVAGKQKGFQGERSVLAFEFLRLAESLKPRWLLLENVPGLLSSNRGADFARLIDEVVGCGYGVAWRILNARYFGVPQRRRRVFIVARRADSYDDPRIASRVALRTLFESSIGDFTPGWPQREETTGSVERGTPSGSGEPIAFYYSGGGNDSPSVDGVSPTVKKGTALDIGSPPAIAYRKSKRAQTERDDETWVDDGEANTLNRFDLGDTRTTHAITQAMTVRRLTPVEVERLTGLPDNWTAPEGVKAPDSKRYAACGDAIVTPVAYWIGQRIQKHNHD